MACRPSIYASQLHTLYIAMCCSGTFVHCLPLPLTRVREDQLEVLEIAMRTVRWHYLCFHASIFHRVRCSTQSQKRVKDVCSSVDEHVMIP